jgi:hypothetical protein
MILRKEIRTRDRLAMTAVLEPTHEFQVANDAAAD